MKSTDHTLSVTEAGQAGRWSYPQVVRLLMTGKLSGTKYDGRWRIDADSVERLKAERTTQHCDVGRAIRRAAKRAAT